MKIINADDSTSMPLRALLVSGGKLFPRAMELTGIKRRFVVDTSVGEGVMPKFDIFHTLMG
jgi:hypothetical protein